MRRLQAVASVFGVSGVVRLKANYPSAAAGIGGPNHGALRCVAAGIGCENLFRAAPIESEELRVRHQYRFRTRSAERIFLAGALGLFAKSSMTFANSRTDCALFSSSIAMARKSWRRRCFPRQSTAGPTTWPQYFSIHRRRPARKSGSTTPVGNVLGTGREIP